MRYERLNGLRQGAGVFPHGVVPYSQQFHELRIGEPTHHGLRHGHSRSTRIQLPNQDQGRDPSAMYLVSKIVANPGLHVVEHDIWPSRADAETKQLVQPLVRTSVANIRVNECQASMLVMQRGGKQRPPLFGNRRTTSRHRRQKYC
ncbi:hypothetical protein D9M68_892370 [compost metagenome]